MANMAGTINAFLADAHIKYWVIDSGASNHMVADINMLSTKEKVIRMKGTFTKCGDHSYDTN